MATELKPLDIELTPETRFTDDERRLYELMSEISEDCWCAGWMIGNEFALWEAITTGDLKYGQSEIDRSLLATVAALSVQTGKWIIWRDDHDGLDPHNSSEWGPYAISLASWEARRSTTPAVTGEAGGDGLTDGQIEALWARHADTAEAGKRRVAFARAIIAAVKAAGQGGEDAK